MGVLTHTALLACIYIPPLPTSLPPGKNPIWNPGARNARHKSKDCIPYQRDEHQVNFKLCYISNCTTAYCQTLCKTTSDRRYIGNRMILRKLIMKYSSTETRSDSAAWQHLDLLIICRSAFRGGAGVALLHGLYIYSHIHVLRRHLLRLASTIPPTFTYDNLLQLLVI